MERMLAVVVAVVAGLWFAWLSDSQVELDAEKAKELTLRKDYTTKLAKAVNLEVLKKQREQVLQYVTQLEKQLPSKAEMDALLSDINQAGLGRSLQFDLFRPGQVVVPDYYAELPISLRVTGRYHDIGAFASDIANLSWAAEEFLLGDRLVRITRVDTGTPEVEQLGHVEEVGCVHDGRVDHHVVVEELSWSSRVGHDATNCASHEVYVLGSVGTELVRDGGLVSEIELGPTRSQ